MVFEAILKEHILYKEDNLKVKDSGDLYEDLQRPRSFI